MKNIEQDFKQRVKSSLARSITADETCKLWIIILYTKAQAMATAICAVWAWVWSHDFGPMDLTKFVEGAH